MFEGDLRVIQGLFKGPVFRGDLKVSEQLFNGTDGY